MFLFDVPPPPFSDPVSIGVGFGFFFVFAAAAVVAFFLLKSRIHVGFRLAIAGVILLIAVFGSVIVSFIAAQMFYKPNRPPVYRQNGITG